MLGSVSREVKWLCILCVLALVITCPTTHADSTLILQPTADGSIAPNGNFNGWNLECTVDDQGVAIFSLSSVTGTVTQALLSVNPDSLPLWGNPVQVYGFSSDIGLLSSSDYNAGTFIGSWTLPSLSFRQDAYFDVTALFTNGLGPYVGFNLRSAGVDVFCSLENNYGEPEELTLTTIPEPSTWVMVAMGIGVVLGGRRLHRSSS
jgi:hypothetical protein